ncbi:reverse transcriptase domain-containing protein [Salipaludibacillus aurantiacus]|uniref:Reverse transcriptase (RNA-dependent DNA polymerase) n=1 Tax=Salipaludibacillus aurantiacus TaxID=1601833 RepID=A0A1H9W228_9BACI|nr:reverse transcriptase domain-containing protein [Salipaludibacillus aurantiacus]SES27898.1 Reverse transcriptase (RNA-dependent DNA polymerase) [Salipaludibacillus aurantiacus]
MNQNNRPRLYTLVSSSNLNEKKYRLKKYKHFDYRRPFQKVKHLITEPSWVAQHGFFPFIHFKITFRKYNKRQKKRKSKEREIFYASHLDSFIYKYYGDILNGYYNSIAKEYNIHNVATAYRNNFKGKNNIHFAKEVIDFIAQQKQAYIFVADFTNFFNNLDHHYLKEQIKNTLKIDSLPPDFYSVFKNITKFSWIDKIKIEEELRKKYSKEEICSLPRYFTKNEYRTFKKDNVQKNKKGYGIPQGAGISSVCSNIYLIEFDRELNEYVKKFNGMYRRYSDDLIVVIPIDEFDTKGNYEAHHKFIGDLKNKIPRLQIQEEKTERLFYRNKKIYNENDKLAKLDYLGFSFDGINVRIREKSLFKFYSRAYKKVRICNRLTTKYKQKAQRKSLYCQYTHLGKYSKGHGNFLTYVANAQRVFERETTTINLMENQVKRHWNKIQKRLDN